jgi:hypothetical protein
MSDDGAAILGAPGRRVHRNDRLGHRLVWRDGGEHDRDGAEPDHDVCLV